MCELMFIQGGEILEDGTPAVVRWREDEDTNKQ